MTDDFSTSAPTSSITRSTPVAQPDFCLFRVGHKFRPFPFSPRPSSIPLSFSSSPLPFSYLSPSLIDNQIRLALFLHLLHEKIQVFITFQHYHVTQHLVGHRHITVLEARPKVQDHVFHVFSAAPSGLGLFCLSYSLELTA